MFIVALKLALEFKFRFAFAQIWISEFLESPLNGEDLLAAAAQQQQQINK